MNDPLICVQSLHQALPPALIVALTIHAGLVMNRKF